MSGTNSRRLAGLASMTIDGDTWDIVSDLAYKSNGIARETLKGQTRVEGYSEMPAECYISATLRDRGDTPVSTLNGKNNCTVVCLLANGKTVYGSGMWQTGDIEVRTQEATFTVRFDGNTVLESVI